MSQEIDRGVSLLLTPNGSRRSRSRLRASQRAHPRPGPSRDEIGINAVDTSRTTVIRRKIIAVTSLSQLPTSANPSVLDLDAKTYPRVGHLIVSVSSQTGKINEVIPTEGTRTGLSLLSISS